MMARILLVNPPIHDFAAYDFWLKPYGLLSVAGQLRGRADFRLFDYLHRLHPFMPRRRGLESDRWGRGRFQEEIIPPPPCLSGIPRYFRRFGLPRRMFELFLKEQGPCDFALIQTVMTYWYPGVQEVVEDIRKICPQAKIILGGNYVTLCTGHAQGLGADFLATGTDLQPLWQYLNLPGDPKQPALWEAYDKLTVGVLKLADGCPFNCTYCSVPRIYGKFKPRPMERSLAELELLVRCGVENIAFYDDALLFDAQKVLVPFLEEVIKRSINVNFHSPNALNARFVTKELAELMLRAGFKTFYLGFESASSQWQRRTGSKVSSDELTQAVRHLTAAGARPANIAAYQLLGHPDADAREIEDTMRFANSLGIRGTLADFSPIPGTPDGDRCSQWVDMAEPLFHNKTAFPIILMGFDETNRLKDLQRKLNRSLTPT
ncbi:MAG TPA: radical SAM protein [Sedimentisphaerales bacterium]|nr:radical SAM protein [Sedimentisphaerales bacterium]